MTESVCKIEGCRNGKESLLFTAHRAVNSNKESIKGRL